MKPILYLCVCVMIVSGCRTLPLFNKTSEDETPQEAASALKSVVGAVTGEEVSDEDLRNLVTDIQKDEDTQTAVQAVTDALSNQETVVKYCPLDGKRYSATMEFCPGTDVPLEIVK